MDFDRGFPLIFTNPFLEAQIIQKERTQIWINMLESLHMLMVQDLNAVEQKPIFQNNPNETFIKLMNQNSTSPTMKNNWY